MQKRLRHRVLLAVLGLAITVPIYASISFIQGLEAPPLTRIVLKVIPLILCPPSLLFYSQFDTYPYTTAGAWLWFEIGLMNSAFYGAVGPLAGRFLKERFGTANS